ncbi:unnamed protein product [Prunus brigantina]
MSVFLFPGVRLWTDKRFPMSPDGLLHPINDELVGENVFVSEIINPITKSWNLSNLNVRISNQDARRIKAMPVGGGCESDRLVWPFSVSGCYSVKIGYYLIHPCYHPNHRLMRALGSHCVSKKVFSPQRLFSSIGIWDHPLCARSVKMSRKQSSTYYYTVFGLPVSSLETCYATELICKASPPLTSGCSVRLLNVDATWYKKTLMASLGAVIRDEHGNFIRGAGKVRLASSPIEA